ncbi:hypothetical protein DPEC_G00140800 [Dallia pectoralis]|uniref:Uncharacterized protein n=1 Tax=Dallia pectoralis TaxID=75939 RepID=A0ACC2GML8_DALPE|nr:hypothetical protein DPEC_G00140800 [Dallia pectoralis]
MDMFLKNCHDVLQRNAGGSPGFHVVLGNEACDLDSMVSAMVYAYFLSVTADLGKIPLPVMNIPRQEFSLRTDNVFLLRESGLSPDDLVFRDEVDLMGLQRAGRLVLTLVDFNMLPRSDRDLEESVVEVIDHHRLEMKTSPSCVVTVETVGSCATLVTERIVQKAPEILHLQMAQLLYGTIVLDCVNMAPEAGKVTPKDSKYTALLETRFPNLPPRGALFLSLQRAKFDVSGLTTEQMLLKDMKVASGGDLKLAVSVIYMTLEAFLQRQNLQRELCEFSHKNRYDIVVAMTICYNHFNEPFRQLAVYSSSTLYREQISQALEQARNPSLSLNPMSSPYTDIKAYLQGNMLASRKKVFPIIKDFLVDRERGLVHCGDSEGSCEVAEQRACAEDTGMDDNAHLPLTPMNSLVEGCPLDNRMSGISAEALTKKFSEMAREDENAGGH